MVLNFSWFPQNYIADTSFFIIKPLDGYSCIQRKKKKATSVNDYKLKHKGITTFMKPSAVCSGLYLRRGGALCHSLVVYAKKSPVFQSCCRLTPKYLVFPSLLLLHLRICWVWVQPLSPIQLPHLPLVVASWWMYFQIQLLLLHLLLLVLTTTLRGNYVTLQGI